MSLASVIQYKENQEKQKEIEGLRNTGSRLDNYLNNPFTNLEISGKTQEERDGKLEGLERAKILTGQNPYEIGADYQEAYGNIKKRSTGQDTGSELLRASKAGAVADARNQLSQQGVKGGAALNAVSAVERAKSYDVNNQLMDHQRKAEMDYMNAVKANANFTTQQELSRAALALDANYEPPSSNSGGTVICTELYRQGFYDMETYMKDQEYGAKMIKNKPHVYHGYRLWADYVVKGMKRSYAFTCLVAVFALPWAENMAGKKNLFGAALSFVFEPVCGVIGRLLVLRGKYAN